MPAQLSSLGLQSRLPSLVCVDEPTINYGAEDHTIYNIHYRYELRDSIPTLNLPGLKVRPRVAVLGGISSGSDVGQCY